MSDMLVTFRKFIDIGEGESIVVEMVDNWAFLNKEDVEAEIKTTISTARTLLEGIKSMEEKP